MATSKEVQQSFEQLLSQVVPIRTRRMFGGVGIWEAELDLFFAMIAENHLHFKVDETTVAPFREHGMQQFGNMNYYRVPEPVLDDPQQLAAWVERAVAVAARAAKRR